jgi:hypothetical protein
MLPTTNTAPTSTPPPLPSLSVNEKGRAYLHSSLKEHLRLEGGQPGNVVPPPTGSPYWHLDLRPEAPCLVSESPRLRIYGVRVPTALLDPDEMTLTLYLLPGEPAIPGYYPMLPAQDFAQAYTAFLEQAALAARQPLT